MKKWAFFANLSLILLIMAFDAFYMQYGGLWLKSVTSALFVLMGAGNLFFALKFGGANFKFCALILTGLVFAMLGDIVLNVHFIGGAVLFAIGHIFFFVSYCFLQRPNWKDLICGLSIFVPAVLFITLAPIFDFGGVLMEIVCVVYALVISFMVGKALANLISKPSILQILILLGSVLFFISDLMLLLNVFANLPKIVDDFCLATYYPAEILLALSILFSTSKIDDSQI